MQWRQKNTERHKSRLQDLHHANSNTCWHARLGTSSRRIEQRPHYVAPVSRRCLNSGQLEVPFPASSVKSLVDCGLFQGYKAFQLKNWGDLPFGPALLDAAYWRRPASQRLAGDEAVVALKPYSAAKFKRPLKPTKNIAAFMNHRNENGGWRRMATG